MTLDDIIIKNIASSHDNSEIDWLAVKTEWIKKNVCITTQPLYQGGLLATPCNNSENKDVMKDTKVTEQKNTDI